MGANQAKNQEPTFISCTLSGLALRAILQLLIRLRGVTLKTPDGYFLGIAFGCKTDNTKDFQETLRSDGGPEGDTSSSGLSSTCSPGVPDSWLRYKMDFRV